VAAENQATPSLTTQLSPDEQENVVCLTRVVKFLDGSPNAPTVALVPAAWNQDKQNIWHLIARKRANPTRQLHQKKRSDAGLTVFSSEKKWYSVFTPYNAFHKDMTKKQAYNLEKDRSAALRQNWNQMAHCHRATGSRAKLALRCW
jgi:hypothetical protein